MRTLGFLLMIGLMASPAAAQGNGRNNRGQGIPPGQMPPAGQCRVWYEGVPPGRQPSPTNCDNAERIASRDSRARVVYGDRVGRNDNRNDNIWRRGGVFDRSQNGPFGNYRNPGFNRGYEDGYQKGREDARDRDSFDPVRHSWYRSGTRGYDSDYGSRDQYRNVYRNGFEAGYREGYRDNLRR